MAITFRIASTASATATSVAPAKPVGLTDGDVLVAVSNVDANETITAPAGWTACFAQVQTGSQTVRAWYRVVASAAAETSTYSFGGTASVARTTTIVCYSGVDNTTPMDVTGLATNNASSTVIHAASITTVTNGAVVVWAGAIDSSTFTVTKPAACTNRNQNTTAYRLTLADLAMPTAGATGSQDGSVGTARVNVGMLIALRPAPSITTSTRTATPVTAALLATKSRTATPVTAALKATSTRTATATMALSGSPTTYSQWILQTAGLMGYWKLDELSGAVSTVVADQTGYNDAIVNFQPVTAGAPGLIGDGKTAFDYSGFTGSVKTNYAAGTPTRFAVTACSMEFWIKYPAWVGNGAIFEMIRQTGFSAHQWVRMSFPTPGGLSVILQTSGGGINTIVNTTMTTNTTYHIVITYDGSFLKVYQNGTLVDTITGNGNLLTSGFTDMFAQIGGGSGSYFGGILDEVAFYNVALSATDVSDHYTAGITITGYPTVTKTATPVTMSLNAVGTRTATPVTMALQAPDKSRTATPVTAALSLTSSRTATPVTAALSQVRTRTATPVTAALSATKTRTATPVTMALQTPDNTRTSTPVTMALKTTFTRTATPITASLSVAATRTATPITAALSGTLTRIAAATMSIQATLNRTANATAALSRTATRAATPITAALQATLTRTATTTAALSATATRTAPATMAVGVTGTRTAPATMVLSGTLTRTAPATMSLSGVGNVRTISSVAMSLSAVLTRTATPVSMSVAQFGVTRTATPITAALLATKTRTATATAALQSVSTRTATPITVALLATKTRTATVTISVSDQRTRTANATASLQSSSTRSAPVSMALSVSRTRTATPITAALSRAATRTAAATMSLTQASSRIATPVTIALSSSGTRQIASVTMALYEVGSGPPSLPVFPVAVILQPSVASQVRVTDTAPALSIVAQGDAPAMALVVDDRTLSNIVAQGDAPAMSLVAQPSGPGVIVIEEG